MMRRLRLRPIVLLGASAALALPACAQQELATRLRAVLTHPPDEALQAVGDAAPIAELLDAVATLRADLRDQEWERIAKLLHRRFNTTPVNSISLPSVVPTWGAQSNIARYDPINSSSGHVYVCNNVLYRLLYNAASATLSYDALLKADIQGVLQDSRIYTFGGIKRFLLAKDSEAFLWGKP
jgi:hypothetical protein